MENKTLNTIKQQINQIYTLFIEQQKNGTIINKWLNLKECCLLKGIKYKTACNRPSLKPDSNKARNIGGRICWDKDYILGEWILKSDDELKK